MQTEFTSMQRSIIQNMMYSKGAKDIALLLGKESPAVAELINEFTAAAGTISYQAKLDKKVEEKKLANMNKPRVQRIRDPRPASQKRSAEEKLADKRLQRENDRIRKEEEKRAARQQKIMAGTFVPPRRPLAYKTVEVDYSKLVTVRIDRTTTIYAKPGEEAAARAQFLKTYSRPIDRI